MRYLFALLLCASTASAQDITLTASPAAETSDRFAVFTFSESPAECSLDGAAYTPCASPHHLLDVPPGAHTLRLRAPGASAETSHTWTVRSVFDLPNAALTQHGLMPDPDPDGGSFRIKCEVSHGSYDDPIVYPGRPGRAHLHLFLGNEEADYASTDTSLAVLGTTTCQGDDLNRSAYWVPTLLHPVYDAEGQPVAAPEGWQALGVVLPTDGPFAPDIYYKTAVDDISSIEVMPRGLRMIAGDGHALGPQDLRYYRWWCESWPITSYEDFSHSIPVCRVGDEVRLTIAFPPCWNGRDLDVPDHKSHMAYPEWDEERGIACPPSHPVTLPQVSYNFAFPVTDANASPEGDSRGWRLASDGYEITPAQPGGYSVHGDWFMAWHPEIMETFVEACLRQGRNCSGGDLGNGWRMEGMRTGRRTFPAVRHQGPAMPTPTAVTPGEPLHAGLEPNHPNPFGSVTTLRYTVHHPGPVRLTVYDALGREVALLVDAVHAPGSYTRTFDGAGLAAGLYVYRIEAGGQVQQRLMTLVR